MKPRNTTILIMLFGLLLIAFAVAMAQTPAQTPAQGDQKQAAKTCCSMESCCCNSGSCPMKKDGTATTADTKDACCCSGDSCDMKSKDAMKKNHAEGEGCCCCDDSCDMKDMMMKHDANMKHDPNMKHDAKADGAKGDCCNMMKHKDAKNKTKQ